MDMVETLSCSNCGATFSDVDQLVDHSAGPCIRRSDDDGRCSSEASDGDDRATTSGAVSTTGDVSAVGLTIRTCNMDDEDEKVDADEVNTASADDLAQPPFATFGLRSSPSFDEDNDDDDAHFDTSDDYILHNMSSQSVAAPQGDTPGPRPFPVLEGRAVDGRTPKSTKAAASAGSSVSQLIDNNVSPASKIAMLESVVYALHQQQMFQLELIEALRRQLATALAASSSSSRPGDEVAGTTLDLTLPRCSSQPTGLDHGGSSLSSLMRLSAGVDAHRGAPVQSPASSPTAAPSGGGTMTDSRHDVAMATAAMATSWTPSAQFALNYSRSLAASIPSPLLSTPKHGQPPPMSDLSLFKKGKAPNVTVMRQSDSAEAGSEDPSAVFKHRCRLCLKVLGSDSALQIHMRSHTGERPYKCNICGNRFTTKGNLKVHFQRHLEQYPNARMNPDPVPEYLDHQDASHAYEHEIARPAHAVSSAATSMMQSFRQPATPSGKVGAEQTPRPSDGPSLTSARENFVGGVVTPSSNGALKVEASVSQPHAPELLSLDSETPFQSPLSALSSMSSALSAFAPQLRMTFPPPPPPPPPMSATPLPIHPGAQVFSPFPVDSSTATLPPPAPPSKDLDDEDLEQYMEIQQTDTARIEELVREATSASGSGDRCAGDSSTTSTDPNECVICHRVLSCRSALLMHYRTHTGERPYRCRLCGRTFTTKGNLKTHMAVHRGRIAAAASTQHRCRVCRLDFPGSVALQQHIRSAHASDMTPASNSSFPANGVGGSAVANAAAMMMMPGVNPLLPFFNFPSFYQTPRNLLPGAATLAGPPPLRLSAQDRVENGGGGELDLRRKSSSVDRDVDDRSSREELDGQTDEARPATKRVKTEDGGSGADADERWTIEEMARNVNGCRGSNGGSRYSPFNDDDGSNSEDMALREGPSTARSENCERNFSADLSAVDVGGCNDAGVGDKDQPPPIREREEIPLLTATESSDRFADRIASQFASPLLALEERVKSLEYSTNVFSRFSAAAGNAAVSRGDSEEFASSSVGEDCDVEGVDAEAGRPSKIQDLRTREMRLARDDGDDVYSHDDRQLSSPSTHTLVMPGRSDVDVGSDDSASSRHSTSPGGMVRPGSSGSAASSSLSGGAMLPPTFDRSDVDSVVQSPSKMSTSTIAARFSCQVCAKPFASASALEIHSRTHSGDRPFVCHVCTKAFTTKGNLKVHMSTHAWNKCPSRRGRRMTVVDPAAAAAVAAASGAFAGSMTAPKDAAAAAAAAAFLSNTFGAGVRFDGAALPPAPPPLFGGLVPPPSGVAGNTGAFLSDNKALLNYCMQAAAAQSAGREAAFASDALRQTMSAAGVGGDWTVGSLPWMVGGGSLQDERNNNNARNGGMPAAHRGLAEGGELDLSARSSSSGVGGVAASSFGDRQTSSAMRSWTAERGSSLPLISNCT